MSNRAIDWVRSSLTGDIGAVPVPPQVSVTHRWRPGKVSISLLAVWLLWELAGLIRALIIGPPVLQAIWEMRP